MIRRFPLLSVFGTGCAFGRHSSPGADPGNPKTSLRGYAGDALLEIAFPLGGIGTGCVSPGGRGALRDCEIFGRPDTKQRYRVWKRHP